MTVDFKTNIGPRLVVLAIIIGLIGESIGASTNFHPLWVGTLSIVMMIPFALCIVGIVIAAFYLLAYWLITGKSWRDY